MPVDQQRSYLLFQRLSRAIRRLSERPLPENVHHFRTTVRRIETLLDTLVEEPGRSQRKLLKRLGRLRRQAGKVRDLDVQLAALRSLKLGGEAARKARLMRELTEERAVRERKLLASFDEDTLRSLRKRLVRVSEDLPQVGTAESADGSGRNDRSAFDPVELALDRFAQVSREHGAPSESTLHEYRMACKRIRYIAEMAGKDPRAKAVIAHLKAMQDAIGSWHDWDVLTRRAEKLFEGEEAPPIVSALRNVNGAKLSEALRVSAESKRELLALGRAISASASRKPAHPARPAERAATA